MNELKQFKALPFSTQLMLICFTIGTLLLALYFIFPKQAILFLIGYVYVLIAILVNFFTLLYLLIQLLQNWENAEIIIIRILILLINIPIAAFYFYLVIFNSSY